MEFEITIEGPFASTLRLCSELEAFSPYVERIPKWVESDQERGRLLIVESNSAALDRNLLILSKTVRKVEKELKTGLDIRVRNLAYSEPFVGSAQFAEPFNPVDSITVQPWNPLLQNKAGPETILLDPLHAFGTGKHPTTKLCLKIMEGMKLDVKDFPSLRGKSVLDFGCGTGLLAIAAIKMGARRALGVEIDSQSAVAAQRNVMLNHLTEQIKIRQGSWEVVRAEYDLILANLVAAALLKTGDEIPEHLAANGAAVVSGFGVNQAGDMESFFEEMGLVVHQRFSHQEWSALVLSGK